MLLWQDEQSKAKTGQILISVHLKYTMSLLEHGHLQRPCLRFMFEKSKYDHMIHDPS